MTEQGGWGRVSADGTVYVRVGDTEHEVGQYPEGTPEEALAFFTKRYDGLAFEVRLLEQRVRKGALSPDEATSSIDQLAASLAEPKVVGDVVALTARLDALRPVIAAQRGRRREEKARKVEDARSRKQELVATAEKIASGRDWRSGGNRLRDLLGEWKDLPRLERSADDELWHRFSAARTSYAKARKAHFAEQDDKRETARGVKQRLAAEAETLKDSTDWGATSGRFRALMQQWKAAGPAPRAVEEDLWKRFRGAQDTFFGARDTAQAELELEYAANAEVKRALLTEAEALVPVTDVEAAKRSFRDIADRWDAAGKVPRDQMSDLEGRMRKIERSIRNVEEDTWRRSDPEKSARADDLVGKLESSIAETETNLARARERGDDKRVAELEQSLASSRSFLAMAEKAAAEFSG